MNYDHFEKGEYQVDDRVIYFRSKWEANYAIYLEFLKKQGEIKGWRYEHAFFEFPVRHGTTRYLPDFEVDLNNGKMEIHEVKGFMDSRSKTKFKRMAKYYPDIPMKIINRDFFKAIKKSGQDKLLKFY